MEEVGNLLTVRGGDIPVDLAVVFLHNPELHERP